VLLEALGERSDFDIAELAAGLERVFLDLVDRELEEGGGGNIRGDASSRALAGAAGWCGSGNMRKSLAYASGWCGRGFGLEGSA
jgi:hypothetical protein